MGSSPYRDSVQNRPRADHKRRLEDNHSGYRRQSIGKREDDLKQPRQIDVGRVWVRKRKQILRRDAPTPKNEFAQAQIEKDIGLVHRNEAAPSHEEQEQYDHARPSCPSCASAQARPR